MYQKQIDDLKRGVVIGSAGVAGPAAAGRDGDFEKHVGMLIATFFFFSSAMSFILIAAAQMRREQQFLQDKIERRRADFKLVQDRVRSENERQLRTQRELRTQISELHNSLEVRWPDFGVFEGARH